MANEFCKKDKLTFAEELKEVSTNDNFLVFFDVNSLFTNIPLQETIKLTVDLIKTSYPNLKISSHNRTKLFKFATCETYFLFNKKFYDQIDDEAMGSLLTPVLVNFFIGDNYINIGHPKIKFTMETKANKLIPFLDVLIDNSQNVV